MNRKRVKIPTRRAIIADLPHDLFKEILIRVGESSNGAKDLALVFSTCKAFRHFVDDGDVLRAVAFDDLLELHCVELFQFKEGLVNRCAQAGHLEAQFLLSRIMLVSTSNLVTMMETNSNLPPASDEDVQGKIHHSSSFVENYLPDHAHSTDVLCKLSHFDLMKLFLSRADSRDYLKMSPYFEKYLQYFLVEESFECQMLDLVLKILIIAYEMVDLIYTQLYRASTAMCLRRNLNMIVEVIERAHFSNIDPVKKMNGLAKCLTGATVPSKHVSAMSGIVDLIQINLRWWDASREVVIIQFDKVLDELLYNDFKR